MTRSAVMGAARVTVPAVPPKMAAWRWPTLFHGTLVAPLSVVQLLVARSSHEPVPPVMMLSPAVMSHVMVGTAEATLGSVP
jgi:hypothetical protein